ncbi:MAG: 50S ribosomal protein L9 [Sciscionella sp.]
MMKLILTAEISGLGAPGDVVEVKDGYGRNYLLPRNLAIAATRGAQKQVETIRRVQKSRQIRDLDHAREVRGQLEALSPVRLSAKSAEGSKKLFGSITAADIVSAIREAGGPALDKRTVETEGHIKTVGKHAVRVRLHPEIDAAFQLEIKGAS